ncbi:MAG: hypothetical protein K0S47_1900 [Herbinix sp.]|jgi:uncharacterized protein YneF (UPF0154 family)|nr:hypothetical protein [Herbinix sp.]
MGRKTLLNILLILLVLLITFFGLGPVLFADGVWSERLNTLLVVVALYIILIFGFYYVNKRIK